MKSIKSVLPTVALALSGLCSSNIAMAEAPPFLGCTSLGCIGVFGSMYVRSNGDIGITTPDNVDTSAMGCTLSGGQYITLKRSHPGFSEIYSMLLAAQVTKQNMYLRTVSNSAGCDIDYAVSYP